MSDYLEISRRGKILKFSLKGKTVPEFENGLQAAINTLYKFQEKEPDAELQTFVDVKHTDELSFFLERGFYIANTMLTMTSDLTKGWKVYAPDMPVNVRKYDVLSEGMEKYLKANAQGFGEADPREMIDEQLSQPDGTIYVACDGDEIVSSITTWNISKDTIATENIFTIPKYREKHIAAHMLTKLMNEAATSGKKHAELTVFGDDLPAYTMYFKLGFEITGARYELRY